MSQNLPSAAVVIGALRVNGSNGNKEKVFAIILVDLQRCT